jgi:hypothetical protein
MSTQKEYTKSNIQVLDLVVSEYKYKPICLLQYYIINSTAPNGINRMLQKVNLIHVSTQMLQQKTIVSVILILLIEVSNNFQTLCHFFKQFAPNFANTAVVSPKWARKWKAPRLT